MRKSFYKLFAAMSIVLSVWSFCSLSMAQEVIWEHTVLNVTHGLAHDAVRSIFQDSEGYMWFGTENGLSRYDGYRFRNYSWDISDTTKLKDNWINTICEEENDILWIATYNGLHKFDKTTEVFTNYLYNKDDTTWSGQNAILDLVIGSDNNLWMGTENRGLVKFERNTEKFTFYPTEDQNLDWLPEIESDGQGNIWVTTESGELLRFNIKTEEYSSYKNMFADIIRKNSIFYTLKNSEDNEFYIAYSYGLCRYNSARDTIEFLPNKSLNKILKDDHINGIMIDDEGNFWINTFGGVYQLSPDMKLLYSATYNRPIFDFLGYLRTREILQSDDGTIWFNSPNGVHKLTKRLNYFTLYQHDEENENSLSNSTVETICADSNDNIWVGTNQGLNRINKSEKRITRFYSSFDKDSATLTGNGITSLYYDTKGTLWVGTHSGFNKLINENGAIEFQRFYLSFPDSSNIDENWVQDFYEDSIGNFWIMYAITKPVYFETRSGKMLRFVNNPDMKDFLRTSVGIKDQEPTGEMWAVGMSGTFLVIPPFKRVSDYDITSADVINLEHLGLDNAENLRQVVYYYRASNNVIWLGTNGGGLNRLDTETNADGSLKVTIRTYKASDGSYSSNIIFSILEDDNGNLWIGTDRGLSKFDPETESFVNYDVRDGLPGRSFYWRAAYKSRWGEMFFGMEDGLISFYPDSIRYNTSVPSIVISNIEVFTTSNAIESGKAVAEFQSYDKVIKLNYDQNFLNFEFAALNFYSQDKNRYKYKLEGYDKEWIDAGFRNQVRYFGLRPGEYTFRVKGTNSDGLWSMEEASIKIIISPPWWRSKIAYAGYFMLLLVIIYLFIKIRDRKLIHDKELLEKIVEKRTLELQEVNTQLKEHHEELEQQKEELQQTLNYLKETQAQLVQSEKMASIGQLTAGIAHEINNPVNYINAGIESLKTNVKEIGLILDLYRSITEENVREMLKTIRAEEEKIDIEETRKEIRNLIRSVTNGAERTTEIVKGLRTFSRLDENEIKPADIHEGIDLTLVMLHNKYKHHVEINKEYGELPPVECFPGKLNQVFMNILSNAIEAIPEKGTIMIKTWEVKSDNKVFISIKDDGEGMSEKTLSNIFNPFFTTKEVGKGTGLGLSISHGIIEQHKGTIKVKSTPGDGTEFIISLPIKQN